MLHRITPINEINVGQGRRLVRNIEQLAMSIGRIGLLNPITVTEGRYLVAGRRRLEACRSLG